MDHQSCPTNHMCTGRFKTSVVSGAATNQSTATGTIQSKRHSSDLKSVISTATKLWGRFSDRFKAINKHRKSPISPHYPATVKDTVNLEFCRVIRSLWPSLYQHRKQTMRPNELSSSCRTPNRLSNLKMKLSNKRQMVSSQARQRKVHSDKRR